MNCCHPGGNWAGQCGPPGSGMPHTWRGGWQRCNVFSASEASNATRCPESKFASWARGGNRTAAQIAAFVAKQEQWRARNADPRRLNRPCKSEYKARGDRGDKLREDCETWCRAKPAHCRMCKCQACSFCTGVCASGLLGDSNFASCEPQCSEASAEDHCRYCRCKGCKFCAAPGIKLTPAQTAALTEQKVLAALPHGPPCTSLGAGDLTFESCDPKVCGAQPAADACGTCRCKGCKACGGTFAPASVAPSAFDAAAGNPAAGVEKRLAGGVVVRGGACTSRWADDESTPMCQPFCSRSQQHIHCSLCKCSSCEWCSAAVVDATGQDASSQASAAGLPKAPDVVPPKAESGIAPAPAPAPASASLACKSAVLGDTPVKECSFVCSAALAPAMCLLCRCSPRADSWPAPAPPPAAGGLLRSR